MDNTTYRQNKFQSMTDTVAQCKEKYSSIVANSIVKQRLILDGTNGGLMSRRENKAQKVIVSPKRTFEAAKAYAGKKITVLNFANAHSVGGAPFYAGAQEEVLCRCSTLYPCIKSVENDFYQKHIDDYKAGKIDWKGTGDIIYTPDVLVFKDDANNEAPLDEPFMVNVITCAAPELLYSGWDRDELQQLFNLRARQIVAVADMYDTEVLILGAFGCGAFGNPPDVVASAFKAATKKSGFETIEYAIFTRMPKDGYNLDVFKKVVKN